jgi:hypothetical protein
MRLSGATAVWDIEAEAAYQHADASNVVKTFFSPDPASAIDGFSVWPFAGPYGDDDASFDSFAANLEVGYTFRASKSPRLYAGFAWFQGHDNRRNTFAEYFRNYLPFFQQDASLGFNRLFSDWSYSEFLDGTSLSNVWILRGGGSISLTEKIRARAAISWFQTDDPVSTTARVLAIPFVTRRHESALGLETALYLTYDYSEHLQFQLGYAHFFARDGLAEGQFVRGNGLTFTDLNSDDTDYVFFEANLRF